MCPPKYLIGGYAVAFPTPPICPEKVQIQIQCKRTVGLRRKNTRFENIIITIYLNILEKLVKHHLHQQKNLQQPHIVILLEQQFHLQ